jgi:hypothetical protein
MTETWWGRISRLMAFLGGCLFTIGGLAAVEIGFNGRITGGLVSGAVLLLASFMIGDDA